MEFEVRREGPEGGALLLQRVIRWGDAEGEDGYRWCVRFAVIGMAGAVSLKVGFSNHRAEVGAFRAPGSVQSFAATFEPEGVSAHAYRPVPGAGNGVLEPAGEDCDLLWGGVCHLHELDWPSLVLSTDLVRRLGQPEGVAFMWEELERTYRQEFVPALTAEQILRRDRLRGAALAEARLEGPPPPREHVLRLEREGLSGPVVAMCTCGWASQPDSEALALSAAEAHVNV